MAKVTLEFDETPLMFAAAAFQRTNDALNAVAMEEDTPTEVYQNLFADNDDARLELAELLYDAYLNHVRNGQK